MPYIHNPESDGLFYGLDLKIGNEHFGKLAIDMLSLARQTLKLACMHVRRKSRQVQ